MKRPIRLLITFVVLAVVLGGLILAYREMRKERDLEATAETPVVAASRVERDKDGTPLLKLDADTQQRLGVQTALPVAGVGAWQLTATARVLDGGTLAGQLNDIRAAQMALDAVRLDYERKKRLFDNGQNASAAAVEAADALLRQSEVTLEASRDRLAAAWGANIATRADLKALARSLLAREAALVRVELLATAKLASEPRTVRLLRQNGDELATAHVLGPALTTDSAVIGQAFLTLVATNAASLVPGSSIIAQFDTGTRDVGVVLPRDAVVRHAGQGWVYVETGPQTFTRRAVPLDRPHSDGWLVPGQWTQPIIISGAQSLLSEELKGSIQMRD
jgi:hypothetical protein